MAKRFIRQLSMILIAAVLVTSCPLSVLAFDETEATLQSQTEVNADDLSENEDIPDINVIDNEADADSNGIGEEITPVQTGATESESIIKIDDEAADDEPAEGKESEASPSITDEIELTSEAVDGVIVTVVAPEGVFPENARLVVNKVAQNNSDLEDIEIAVDNAKLIQSAQGDIELNDDAERHAFDIKVVDDDGTVLQPASNVQVKFTLAKHSKKIREANVYHLEQNSKADTANQTKQLKDALDGEGYSDEETTVSIVDYSEIDGDIVNDLESPAEVRSVSEEEPDGTEEGSSEPAELKESSLIARPLEVTVEEKHKVGVETDGFSYYVVELLYEGSIYIMDGGSEVPLADILDELDTGIDADSVTEVEVSNEDLLSAVQDENYEWYIRSLQPINEEAYIIVYTEDDDEIWIDISDGSTYYADSFEKLETVLENYVSDGDTVIITGDITTGSGRLYMEHSITLDLQGWSYQGRNSNPLINITAGSDVRIIATGLSSQTLRNTNSNGKFILNNGNVTIDGGRYIGKKLITNNGTMVINQGHFSGENTITNSQSLTINGGTFESVTPISSAGGTDETYTIVGGSYSSESISDFVYPGYEARYNAATGYYDVVLRPVTNAARVISSQGYVRGEYATLSDAIEAAHDNDTVRLLKSQVYGVDYSVTPADIDGIEIIGKSITLDFDIYKYEGWISVGDYTGGTGAAGTLRLIGSNLDSPVSIDVVNGSALTIEGGKFTTHGALSSSAFISIYQSLSAASPNSLTINGGTFRGIISNNGYTEINGGTLTGCVENDSANAAIHINGGTFNGTHGLRTRTDVAIYAIEGGRITVNGGIVNGSIAGLKDSVIEVYNPTVDGGLVVDNTSTMTVYGGRYTTVTMNDLYAFSNASLTLLGGMYYEPYGNSTAFQHNGMVDPSKTARYVGGDYWWLIGPAEEDLEAEIIRSGQRVDAGTLAMMLTRAESDDTVRLLKDLTDKTQESYTVGSGITLDLHGYDLRACNVNAILGILTDSMVATDSSAATAMGSIGVEERLSVASDNPCITLFDTSKNAYRLFEYTINTNFGQDDVYSYIKSQYQIRLTNSKNRVYGYSLMAGGYSKLQLSGYISWHNKDGIEVRGELGFTDQHVMDYGSALGTNPDGTTVFFLKLSRITKLESHNRIIKTCPQLSVQGVTGTFTNTITEGDSLTKYAQLSTAGASISDQQSYEADTEPWTD